MLADSVQVQHLSSVMKQEVKTLSGGLFLAAWKLWQFLDPGGAISLETEVLAASVKEKCLSIIEKMKSWKWRLIYNAVFPYWNSILHEKRRCLPIRYFMTELLTTDSRFYWKSQQTLT